MRNSTIESLGIREHSYRAFLLLCTNPKECSGSKSKASMLGCGRHRKINSFGKDIKITKQQKMVTNTGHSKPGDTIPFSMISLKYKKKNALSHIFFFWFHTPFLCLQISRHIDPGNLLLLVLPGIFLPTLSDFVITNRLQNPLQENKKVIRERGSPSLPDSSKAVLAHRRSPSSFL